MLKVFQRLGIDIPYIIISMSSTKKDICNRLSAIEQQYTFHVCKYIMYHNKDNGKYKNHWAKEIMNFLREAQLFKFKSNKKPNKEFLKEWFFSLRVDDKKTFEAMLDIVEEKCELMKPAYPKRTVKVDIDKGWVQYQKFVDSCIEDMETGDLTRENLNKYLKFLENTTK